MILNASRTKVQNIGSIDVRDLWPNRPLQPTSGGWFRLLRMIATAARG